jgi:competence protein ComEC
VLRVQVGSLQLLLPGDIDAGQERAIVSYWGEAVHSDWLMAAHHGSKSSSSRLWIRYVQPSQLVFSSGYGNAFAHPHPEVLSRSAEEGRSLYQTSSGGALEFYLGRNTITQAHAHRLAQKRYWF